MGHGISMHSQAPVRGVLILAGMSEADLAAALGYQPKHRPGRCAKTSAFNELDEQLRLRTDTQGDQPISFYIKDESGTVKVTLCQGSKSKASNNGGEIVVEDSQLKQQAERYRANSRKQFVLGLVKEFTEELKKQVVEIKSDDPNNPELLQLKALYGSLIKKSKELGLISNDEADKLLKALQTGGKKEFLQNIDSFYGAVHTKLSQVSSQTRASFAVFSAHFAKRLGLNRNRQSASQAFIPPLIALREQKTPSLAGTTPSPASEVGVQSLPSDAPHNHHGGNSVAEALETTGKATFKRKKQVEEEQSLEQQTKKTLLAKIYAAVAAVQGSSPGDIQTQFHSELHHMSQGQLEAMLREKQKELHPLAAKDSKIA